MKKEKFIKICPRCGGKNVSYGMVGPTPMKEICKDCNIEGFFPEVAESKIEDFRKKFKKLK